MNANSIQTYIEFVKPNITKRESEVLEVIKQNPTGISIYEVAIALKRFPNQVSGRFSALVDKGLIKAIGFKKLPGMNTNHSVFICVV